MVLLINIPYYTMIFILELQLKLCRTCGKMPSQRVVVQRLNRTTKELQEITHHDYCILHYDRFGWSQEHVANGSFKRNGTTEHLFIDYRQ